MTNFRPSAINEFIATLPEPLQIKALEVIIEEDNRWESGDLTDEEKKWFPVASELGRNMAKRMEDIISTVKNTKENL